MWCSGGSRAGLQFVKVFSLFLKALSSALGGRWVSDKQVRGVYLEWTVGTIGKGGKPRTWMLSNLQLGFAFVRGFVGMDGWDWMLGNTWRRMWHGNKWRTRRGCPNGRQVGNWCDGHRSRWDGSVCTAM